MGTGLAERYETARDRLAFPRRFSTCCGAGDRRLPSSSSVSWDGDGKLPGVENARCIGVPHAGGGVSMWT